MEGIYEFFSLAAVVCLALVVTSLGNAIIQGWVCNGKNDRDYGEFVGGWIVMALAAILFVGAYTMTLVYFV